MPLIALLLCCCVVLLLLYVEQRNSHGTSLAVWIPTLWMMMTASRPLSSWFGITPAHIVEYRGNESGSVLDRWGLTVLAVVAVVVFIRRRFNWKGSLRRHKWLALLLAYMFVSTFWSDLTLIALRRWIRELIALIMAFCLMSEPNPRQALACVLRRTAYVLIPFSLVLIKYYPTLGRSYGRWSGIEMWTGVTGQKNQLGRLCMLGAFFLLWEIYRWGRSPKRRLDRRLVWANVCIVGLALYLLRGSDSSTSLAILALGVFMFGSLALLRYLKRRVPQAVLVVLVVFVMGFGTSTPFLGGANIAAFSGCLRRDETLTGRTEVWADVLPDWQKRPLLGYGLGSFWTDARRKAYDIPTAHNGYLDVLLDGGVIGLVLYAAWMMSCSRQLYRALSYDHEWGSFGICLLLMGLVYNITESALNTFTEQMTVLVALTCLIVPHKIAPLYKSKQCRPESVNSCPGELEAWIEFVEKNNTESVR